MKSEVSAEVTGSIACVVVSGELDYDDCDVLTDLATSTLARYTGLSEIHLDFAGLTGLHTSALAAVLLIQRKAAQAGVRLQLVNRPAFLDHTLDVTGLREHLTGRGPRLGERDTAPTGPATSVEHQSL